MKSVVLALCTALLAPYQCGTRTTKRPVEDTAPQALWTLAERFETDGDEKARTTALRQLAESYPSSRYGKRARIELGLATEAETEAEAETDGRAEDSANDEKTGKKAGKDAPSDEKTEDES